MFSKQDFADWRDNDFTQDMLKTFAQAANETALTILNRRESNPTDDAYLKGYLRGLSDAAGYAPQLIDETGAEVPDEV
jgi:hypothetical protein